jgi:glutathione synthase/RimK-type ligase-like ATP-grasp enzyme
LADASASPHFLSAHARYARRAAEACGYQFRSLDGADGYLFEVRDGERAAMFAAGAGTPYALNDARAASIARDKAFCAEVLRQAGVPVLPGEKFFVTKRWAEMRSPGREPEDALAFAARAPFPIFCKPLSASNGLFAEVIDSAEEFADYMARVSREHFAILIQPYVRASEYRVFVLNGRPLFSYHKKPPSVWGNGEHTLAALVAALPRDAEAPPLKARGRDTSGRKLVAADVPEKNVLVVLDGPANRAAGGGVDQLCDGAPRALGEIALRATESVGLALSAVDIFVGGPHHNDFTVIEVNSNPMIATLEDNQRWHLIIAIWRANFDAALR